MLETILSGAKILADIGSTWWNNSTNEKIANQNLKFQREAQAQNLALQREQWAREDNAISRRVADLQANGLSKTLAAGSGASSSAPMKVEALNNQFSPEKYNIDVAKAVQMSQDFALGKQNIENAKDTGESIKAGTEKTKAETAVLESEADSKELDNDLKEETLYQKYLDNIDKITNLEMFGHTQPTREERWLKGAGTAVSNVLGGAWNLIPSALQGLNDAFGGNMDFSSWRYNAPIYKPGQYGMNRKYMMTTNSYTRRQSSRYMNRYK